MINLPQHPGEVARILGCQKARPKLNWVNMPIKFKISFLEAIREIEGRLVSVHPYIIYPNVCGLSGHSIFLCQVHS